MTNVLAGALLAVVTAAAYAPVRTAGFIWDDDAYVTSNSVLWSDGGLKRIWAEWGATPQYYPLVFTTFWIEYRMWHLSPVGYHVANVLLHAASAMLLWRILRRLDLPGAWVVAAVFAVHPVHVESVAWVTERKNVLSGLMYFAATWAYLRFDPGLTKAGAYARNPGFYVVSFLCFGLALLSKTVAGTLPAALLLLAWWKKGRLTLRDAVPLFPMFVAAFAMSRVTIAMEKYHVRTVDLQLDLSFADRILIAGRAAWFYVWKLIRPINLAFSYEKWSIDPAVWWQWLFPLACAVVVAGLWCSRHRIGRGPLTAVLFFAGTLLPALGFVDIYPFRYSWVADHFQYLASIGPIAAVVALGCLWGRRLDRRVLAPAAASLIAVLAALTYAQCRIYHDQESLWLDTIAKTPSSWMARDNLANYFVRQGRLTEAEELFAEGAALNPDKSRATSHEAFAVFSSGDFPRAIEMFEREQRESGDTPFLQVNLGLCRFYLRQYDVALQHFDNAITMRDDLAVAWFHRGRTLAKINRRTDAEAALRKALTYDRANVETYRLLAQLLMSRGQLDSAQELLEDALVVRPNDVHALVDSAVLLARRQRLPDALARARQAATLDAGSSDAMRLLGMLLVQTGDAAAGIDALRRAAELNPADVDARFNLSTALAAQGRLDEADRWCREALKIDPNDADAAALLADLTRRRSGGSTTKPSR